MKASRVIGFPICILAIVMILMFAFPLAALAATPEYPIPTASSHPYAIVSGPDGALWFTESAGNKIGRSSASGAITEFPIPTPGGNPHGIASTSDSVWFTEWATNKIGRLTMTGTFSEFGIPTPNSGPWGIALGPDGALWFTEWAKNQIGRCTQDGVVTEFPIPTVNSQPMSIVTGPDGALWFTEWNSSKIGRCTTAGAVTEFNVPTAGAGPNWITVGMDGALWFTEWNANKIGRCTTAGGITETNIPTANSNPAGIVASQDGTLWFVESAGNKIGRCSPAGVVTNEYAITTASSGSSQVTVGPDQKLWFCEWGANRIGTMSMPTPVWYLAEGTTAWGFISNITIQNPNSVECTAQVTYDTGYGSKQASEIKMPPASQATVNPQEVMPNQDFSTVVTCKEGLSLAVDRTMSWLGTNAAATEGHNSIGVTSPNTIWYMPEGSTAWGFECWLLIQNPNPVSATCHVTYMIEGQGPKTVDHVVTPNSRKSFDVSKDIGAQDASIKVTSDVPVIPERSMYRNNRREGTDSIGATRPSPDYFLSEGSTNWGFTTYVLVQNPNDTPAAIDVTYMTGNGPVAMPTFTMPANSRRTIRVNDLLPSADFSTKVHGSLPIIAERSMYWGANTLVGEAGHDSIGLASPHMTFYLPDGQALQQNSTITYTLVQNPNPNPVHIKITYMTPDGTNNQVVTDTVGAGSRKTYRLNDKIKDGYAAVMAQSLDAGAPIMVEYSMYWNEMTAGACSIGGYSD
jgi:virginiamycin B lyase